jgi:hypothetical protein
MLIFMPVTPVWIPMYRLVEWSMQSPTVGKWICSFVTDHPLGSIDFKNWDMMV